MFRSAIIFLVSGLLLFCPCTPVLADNCAKCHVENDVTVKIPPTPPIRLVSNGNERSINLEDAFRFHGHECPGVTTAFLAVRYGIKLLYGATVPRQDDLLILCPHPARGVVELIDYVMKGENDSDRTWPLDGMKKSRENFVFTLIRKSECLAVNIQLKPDQWPADFFKLKRKQKEKTLTKEEWETLHDYTKNIIMKFPTMSDESLFGNPVPFKTLIWGTIKPSEIDGNIREMRRAKKKSDLSPRH